MHVVVLGGADNQLACIAAARRLGADVTVVDPRPDVPGVALSNSWINLDVMDTAAILRQVGKVDAVLTDQSDYAALAAAHLAAALELPGQPMKVITACTDKAVMRRVVAEVAPDLIPTFTLAADPDAVLRELQSSPHPLVIKPTRSQGSRGVSVIRGKGDLPLIEEAFRRNSGASVLLEQAITAPEYSVDGYVRDGAFTPLAISRKSTYEGNPCLDERLDFLPSLVQGASDALVSTMTRLVDALGITFGAVHAELFCTDGDVTLVELALRGGGSGISSHVVPYLSGFDPAEALLRDLLGLAACEPSLDFRERSAILRFLPAGRVPTKPRSLKPYHPPLLAFTLTNPDTSTSVPRSSEDRGGYIITGATTELEARDAEIDALKRLGYKVA